MRILMTALMATTVLATATHQAEAARGGTQENLEFVADTQFSDNTGAALSLCHLVRQKTVFSIPLHTSSKGYALAPNGCETESYFPFTAQDLAAAQADQMLAGTIPAEPSIGPVRTASNYALLGFGGFVLLFGLKNWLGQKFSGGRKATGTGKTSQLSINALDAMCHMAKADGQVDGSEVTLIAAAAQKLTGMTFAPDRVAQMIDRSQTGLTELDCARFAHGLNRDELRMVLRGVIMVATADGRMAAAESDFLSNLSAAFNVSQAEVLNIMKSVMGIAPAPVQMPTNAAPA